MAIQNAYPSDAERAMALKQSQYQNAQRAKDYTAARGQSSMPKDNQMSLARAASLKRRKMQGQV